MTDDEKSFPFGNKENKGEENGVIKREINKHLKLGDFAMKRIDFLHELNLKHVRETQSKAQDIEKKNSEE